MRKTKSTERRASDLYEETRVRRESLCKNIQGSVESIRLAKTDAYELAKLQLELIANHRDWLLSMVRSISEYQGDDDPLGLWVQDLHKPISQIGEDPHALFSAVEHGLTLDEYLRRGAAAFLAHLRGEKQQSRTQARLDRKNVNQLSTSDKLTRARAITREARTQAVDLEATIAERDARIVELEAQVAELGEKNRQLRAQLSDVQQALQPV